ncbi:unnamed protein product [Rotaria sp. Silwood1]|nr:unnamed protein product [Rotaria sp. Silwood1]CAF1588423.1 unnamed protein product [Rotaria sp. Silwood1]
MNQNKLTTAANNSLSPSTINRSKKPLSISTTDVVTASSGSPAITAKATSAKTVRFQHVRKALQNFRLVWLDSNLDESKDEYKKIIQYLRHIVISVTIFTDVHQCIDFLNQINDEKVFIIVSGSLGRDLMPEINGLPQLYSTYIFCGNPSVHERWSKTISKVKGVYTRLEPIYTALRIDCERCDQTLISMSFHGIDDFFMYTQLFKEVLLKIDDNDVKSIQEFVDYCRVQGEIPEDQIAKIEREYRLHTYLWWYTAPNFIYSILNRALRLLDVDMILKIGFFIRDLHRYIEQLHREQQSMTTIPTIPFQVFRGQGLSIQGFEKLTKTEGGLMSFNNFLSTSRNRHFQLSNFARPAASEPDLVGVLFIMTIDPKLCTTLSIPFVNNYSSLLHNSP